MGHCFPRTCAHYAYLSETRRASRPQPASRGVGQMGNDHAFLPAAAACGGAGDVAIITGFHGESRVVCSVDIGLYGPLDAKNITCPTK